MLKRFDELGWACPGQIGDFQFFALLVIDTPNAAEIMIAIRPDGSIGRTMAGSARVVMHNCLVVKIADVKRAVGTNARLDRPEPHVSAANELRLTSLVGDVTDAVGLDDLMVNYIDGGFCREIAVVPIGRPGAAVVDGATGGSS